MDAKPHYVLQHPLEALPDHVDTEDTKSLVLHVDTQVLTDGVTMHAPELQGSMPSSCLHYMLPVISPERGCR